MVSGGGATTLWDDWSVAAEDRQYEEEITEDLEHSGYTDLEQWMYCYVCGICLSEMNGNTIRIEPHPDRRLGFASARTETDVGTIKSAWKYNPDQTVTYKIEIPFDTEAEVILPEKTLHITAGRHVIGQ